MRINRDLLPIKSHIFLRNAGSAPLGLLLPLMVRQKGLSDRVVGLLWTILPTAGFVSVSISGALADYLKAYRAVLMASIVALTSGISFVYWIPAVPIAQGTNLTAPNLTTTLDDVPAVPPSGDAGLSDLVHYRAFWLIFFSLMAYQLGISTCNALSDAVCFQILGSERHKYGQQMLWGTIGMGVVAILSGASVDLYSRGLVQKDYLPAIALGLSLMAMDLWVVARLRMPIAMGQRIEMGAVGSVVAQPQVLLFLLTVFVMGISLGLCWVFKLMLMEDVALAWDPHFPALKLLQGLDMAIENFGGEVPFYILSGTIIQRVGHRAVMAISVMAVATRHCLYSAVVNPWWFLPIALLNGPSYSLFRAGMASYASQIAPPGAQATLQSITNSSFCAGKSTAGFLGGMLIHSMGGYNTFLAIGIFDFVYCLVFGFLSFLIWKCRRSRKSKIDSGHVPPSTLTSIEECSKEDDLPVKKPLMEDV